MQTRGARNPLPPALQKAKGRPANKKKPVPPKSVPTKSVPLTDSAGAMPSVDFATLAARIQQLENTLQLQAAGPSTSGTSHNDAHASPLRSIPHEDSSSDSDTGPIQPPKRRQVNPVPPKRKGLSSQPSKVTTQSDSAILDSDEGGTSSSAWEGRLRANQATYRHSPKKGKKRKHYDSSSSSSDSSTSSSSSSSDNQSRPSFNSNKMTLEDRVPPKLKKKIWRREYVELDDLFAAGRRPGYLFESHKSRKKNKMAMHSILDWVSAFNVYAAVYLARFPEDACPVMQYIHNVMELSRLGGDWLAYDQCFRMARASAHAINWDQLDTELYMQFRYAKQPSLSGQSPFRGKNRPVSNNRPRASFPQGTCWKFHAGRTCGGCAFQHTCFVCEGFHPIFKCRNNKSQNSGSGKQFPQANNSPRPPSQTPSMPRPPFARPANNSGMSAPRPSNPRPN